MVISILMVIVGLVAMSGLPTAQFPNIVPPEMQVKGYVPGGRCAHRGAVGGHAHRAADVGRGQHELHVFPQRERRLDEAHGELRRQDGPQHGSDPCPDAANQANSQLPTDVINQGVTVQKSTSSPLDHVRPLFPERDLRQRLPGQLLLHQHQRPDDPRARNRQRHRLRRRAVRHAPVGETRPACLTWGSPFPRSSMPSSSRTPSTPPARSAANRYRRARSSPMRFAPRAASKTKRSSATS